MAGKASEVIQKRLTNLYAHYVSGPLLWSLVGNTLCYGCYVALTFIPKAGLDWLLLPSIPIALSGT